MMLSISKELLGIHEYFELESKWVDATVKIQSVEDLYEFGDAAPFGRLNYLFSSRA